MKRPDFSKDISDDNHLKINGDVQFTERDEGEVWCAFLNGDDQCLVYIYRKYVDALYRYGQQFSKRYEFIQDCIQELFYELIDRRQSLSIAISLKAYLLVSLKRKLLREVKKEQKRQSDQEGFTFSFDEPTLSIHTNLKEEDYNVVYQKINELPSSQREVIFLYFYEGFGYAEIAEIMNIKTATARTLTYRALQNLENNLGPYLSSFYSMVLITHW